MTESPEKLRIKQVRDWLVPVMAAYDKVAEAARTTMRHNHAITCVPLQNLSIHNRDHCSCDHHVLAVALKHLDSMPDRPPELT